jgi:predicted metal-binding membrane protein
MSYSAIEKRDRRLVLGALAVLAALAWGYTIYLGAQHASMAGAMARPMAMKWTLLDFAFMLVMWAVMMFAMMLPSVTPTVMIFGRVRERRELSGRPFAPTGAFVSGYLLAWVGFSLVATGINWWLHTNGSMTSMMGKIAPVAGGSLLIVAGLFQWTPIKDACLDHCRSPMSFLMQHWREGSSGAMMMGLHHGTYCLGCCWMLMLLLFVLGVMKLPWVALVTIVVLAEKVLPHGRIISRSLGLFLIVWGAWLIATG